jgi:transcriptional regulator with XRE-family HTH domain
MRLMRSGQQFSGDIAINYAISAAQCRAARAMLEMPRASLAKCASVGERTIADFESRSREPIRATLAAIQRALETAGVEFLPDNGVRLKARPAAPSGSGSGGAKKSRSTGKSAASRKPPERKAAPSSKLDQIRALREQGAR